MKQTHTTHLIHLAMVVTVLLWKAADSDGLPCPTKGWFGENCRYKCHCVSDSCNSTTGECTGSSSACASGWFGPVCQYVDLVHNNASEKLTWLNDSLNCQGQGSPTVNITFPDVFYFTWLRLRVSTPGISKNVIVQFSTSIDGGPITTCPSMKSAAVSDTVLDMECDPGVPFQQLILTGDGVISLCSLYVSGGRNVALNQNTTQSSLFEDGNPGKAVDGNRNNDYNKGHSCSHTDVGDSSPSWTLTFQQTQRVSRYVLYNRGDSSAANARIQGFVLKAYQNNGSLAFSYTDNITEVLPIYNVISTSAEVGILNVTISTKEFVTLCEVEIFGDTVCETGRYGRECENRCKCVNLGDYCFVSSGGCPSGCASGYQGEGCQRLCDATFYGENCTQKCDTGCKNQLCNATNGNCECVSGRQGPKCDQDCGPTFYGESCTQNCSRLCKDQLCEATNGTCKSCVAGKSGENCTEDCKDKYYGENCTPMCSINCNNTLCNRTHGMCYSCVAGRFGDFCNDCAPTFFDENCSQICSPLCKDQLCEATNLTCKSCVAGKSGQQCTEDLDDDGGSIPVGVIVGPIVGFIVLVLVIIIGVIIWRRCRHKKDVPGSDVGNSFDEFAQISRGHNEDASKPTTNELASYNPTKNKKPPVQAKPDQGHENNQNSALGGVYYNQVQLLSDTVISVQDLNNFMASHTKEFFQKQFASIPANSSATITVASNPSNQHKNRYKNISAYDHSRVHLQMNSAKKHGDYINASYINGFKKQNKFIASQGPTKIILEDFVRMLSEQGVEVVVILTNLIEDGKLKCEQYWPDDGQIDIGEITIKLTTTQVFADYTIRRLELNKKSEPVQIITHFHFTTWPDKDVPTTAWGLVDLEQRMAQITTDKPIVVHCSAGVGRTGTFIALHNVLEEIEETGHMDFFKTVQKLRNDRIFMVQTYGQYEFLHKATQIALVCKDTTVTSTNIQNKIQTLEEKSPSGQTNLEKEFKLVCKICDDDDDDDSKNDDNEQGEHMYNNSRMITNKMKNRLNNILPKEYYRPILASTNENMGDYINAVFVPSYRSHKHQFLTQLPLPTTITDLWRLVTQYKVSLIVAFEKDLKAEDMTIGDYLPEGDNVSTTSSFFNIKITTTDSNFNWKIQRIVITIDAENNVGKTNTSVVEKEYSVSHIACQSTDLNSEGLLALVRQIWSMKSVGEGRILYMCRNGAMYSGLVCTMGLLLNQMDNNQQVSVPLVLGTVKAIRPQVIPTLEQYRLLYKTLSLFVETNNVYSNY